MRLADLAIDADDQNIPQLDALVARGWFRNLVGLARVVLGAALLAVGGLLIGLSDFVLPGVSPVDAEVRGPWSPSDLVPVLHVVPYVFLGLALVATLRRPGVGPRCDVLSLGGAAVMAVGLAAGARLGHAFSFSSPDITCLYASCWPMRAQTAVATLPVICCALTQAGLAIAGTSIRWRWRVMVPCAVFVVTTAAVRAAWTPWALPIFQGPSPPWAF